MESSTLFDLETGRAWRDEGVARVDRAEPEAWKAEADEVIAELAATGREFTAWDVRERVGDPDRPNAFGSRFLKASKAGLIVCVGRRPSPRPSLHAHEIRVWRGV